MAMLSNCITSKLSLCSIINNTFYGNQAMHGGALLLEMDESLVSGNLCYDNHATGKL